MSSNSPNSSISEIWYHIILLKANQDEAVDRILRDVYIIFYFLEIFLSYSELHECTNDTHFIYGTFWLTTPRLQEPLRPKLGTDRALIFARIRSPATLQSSIARSLIFHRLLHRLTWKTRSQDQWYIWRCVCWCLVNFKVTPDTLLLKNFDCYIWKSGSFLLARLS